jgi:chemotaxis protein MotB
VSHDRWLVSYADFITLLFAFFAMMYAVSSVDARRLDALAKGLRVAFDEQAPQAAAAPRDVRMTATPREGTSTEQMEATIVRELAEQLASNRLGLSVDRSGVFLSIPEAGTFSTGNDELSAAATQLVADVARTVTAFPNAIRVEGHADNLPINTVRFRSNWDLSAARASRVVEMLIREGIEPSRLAATGYAEFQPRVPNESDTARAANRRVDLVILNTLNEMPEQPGERGTP